MSKDLGEVVSRFFWLLGQAFHVGFPLGMLAVAAVTLIFVLLAAWKMPAAEESRRRLPCLMILPALWIFLGVWGAYFAYQWGVDQPKNPDWVSWPIAITIFVFAIAWVFLLIFLKGARVVTLLFGIWNLYFMLVMTLLAAMSISGNWM